MTKYQLAAFDLDDTLLNEEKKITPQVVAALQKLQNAGVTVTLATGRHFRSAAEFAQQLAISAPLICYNGAMIRHPASKEAAYVNYLQEALIHEMVAFCHSRNLYLQMYDENNNIVVESITWQTLADPDYYTTGCIEVGDFSTLAHFATPKMMIYDEPELIDQLNRELAQKYAGKLYLAQSKDYLLEMMNPDVNKGTALARLAQSMGLLPEQVLAFGDNSNDAEMVRWAGCGVAVANSTPSLKAVADYLCTNPRGEGVIEAISHLL